MKKKYLFSTILSTTIVVLLVLAIYTIYFFLGSSAGAEFKFSHLENPKITERKNYFSMMTPLTSDRVVSFGDVKGTIVVEPVENTKDAFLHAKEREKFFLGSIYEKDIPPYLGAIEVKEECPAAFLPVIFDEIDNSEYRLFGFTAKGSKQHTLGACDRYVAKFTMLRALMECKKTKSIYLIKLTLENPDLDSSVVREIFQAFRCN